MRVVVTGGAGFIGSNLVRALVQRGAHVTVVDNLATTWSLRLIEDADITTAFSFKYSPRPGTPAAEMDDQIDEDVKADRLGQLQALVNRQHERFQQSCVGRTFDVLFDKPGKFDGQITGRSPYLQPVQVTGSPSLIGTIAPVTITGTRTDAKSLFGVIAQPVGQLHKAAAFAEAGA